MIGRGPLSLLLLFALISPALAGAVTDDDRLRFEEALASAHANRLGGK